MARNSVYWQPSTPAPPLTTAQATRYHGRVDSCTRGEIKEGNFDDILLYFSGWRGRAFSGVPSRCWLHLVDRLSPRQPSPRCVRARDGGGRGRLWTEVETQQPILRTGLCLPEPRATDLFENKVISNKRK